MSEIEDDDWYEARLVFNRQSRIYHHNGFHIEPREAVQKAMISQLNRGVEAACVEWLFHADPGMKQFRVEAGQKLPGDSLADRIARGDRNMIPEYLKRMEQGMAGGRALQDDEDRFNDWMEQAANIVMVLEARPEEGPVEKYEDEYPEAVAFFAFHGFEAERLHEKRQGARILYAPCEDGKTHLTEAFWNCATVRIRVEHALFSRMADVLRQDPEGGFMPPAP